ncbi:LexA family protein [Acinetobacter pollinis]|uniref:LexA family protein n=1 Tax=Acinetobacter pollinis TaxID=2605270 RepID=UPI0018C23181|nr:S24 family peptidase [Acinetobacter pollinis]MBF7694050.1 peptidase S24 [Acinetobacter pollinis]MBF7701679.1 peptidase S24 [Acinetobacter pollinis]
MDIIALRRRNLRAVIDTAINSGKSKSDAAFCEHFDLNPSHISQLVKGHGSFGERAARNLEKKIGLEVGFLDKENTPSTEIEKLDNNIVPVTSKLLPVLSWVQAGTMTSVETVNRLEISDWLPPLSMDDPEECFYLRVVGISNFPTYMEGDYILVNPTLCASELISGDLIVVRHNTDATFKKLVIETDGRKYLQALNPNFQPNIIEFEEGAELVGLVIDAFRPLGGSRSKRDRRN